MVADRAVGHATAQKIAGKQGIFIFRHDDGRASTLDYLPVYAAHGRNASWFIVPGYLGQTVGGYLHMAAADVQTIYAAGHEIGSHTFNHVRLDSVDEATRRTELQSSRDELVSIIGGSYTCDVFAYPGNIEVNTEVLDYYLGATGDLGLEPVPGPTDLSRINAGYAQSSYVDHSSLAATTAKTQARVADVKKSYGRIEVIQAHSTDEMSVDELDAVLDVIDADATCVVLTLREWVHYVATFFWRTAGFSWIRGNVGAR